MADHKSTLSMESVDLEDELTEDAQLLTQSKQADYINFNSRRIRLTILTTLYYIWIIPTISIDINTLNGTSSSGGGGGGGNSSLSKDDKIVYRLLISGNTFLLIASIINAADLLFYLYENTYIGKYLRYICGGCYALGSLLHISAASKKWGIHCIDDYGDSWCRSAYYAVDFFAELFSLIMAYDVIFGGKDNYLNVRCIRLMVYSFMLFLTSFVFAIDYGYYVKPLTDADRDNLSGYWIVAITTFIIYCCMIMRMILFRDNNKSTANAGLGDTLISNESKGLELSKMQYISLGLSLMLITGAALCWIKPSVIVTVGAQQPLYRKQFLMFIGLAMIIAYDLQFV